MSDTAKWLHDRLDSTTLEFFAEQRFAVLTPEMHVNLAYKGLWLTMADACDGAGDWLDSRLNSCNLALIFCNPMDGEHMNLCTRLLDRLSHSAPPVILVVHSVAEDLRGKWCEDACVEACSEALAAGVDDVIMAEAAGSALVHAVQSKCQVIAHGPCEHFNRHRSDFDFLDNIADQVHETLWHYLRSRLKLHVPPLDYKIEPGEPFELAGFQVGALLGAGAFGKVFTLKQANDLQVVKMIPKSSIQTTQKLIRLDDHIRIMELLSSIAHPNVVQLYRVHHSETHVLFRMEYAGRINLCQRLSRRDAGHEDLPAARAKSIMSQLIDALAFLHRVAKVAHGDIKSENIIINENEMDITAKIVDFDMAMRADDTTRAVDACGTFPFMAPELVLDRRPLVLPTDVWSTGVVFLEIVCYCRCLEQTLKIHRGTTMKSQVLSQLLMTIRVWFQQSQALASLLESRLRFELREMMGASKVLIEGMLQSEPSKRFTASELLEVIPLLSEGIASELVGSAGSLRPRSVHSGYQ